MEHLIVAKGDSEKSVIENFCDLAAAEIAYGYKHGDTENPLEDIPSAPDDLWEEFNQATPDKSEPRPFTVLALESSQEQEILSHSIQDLRRAA